MDRSDILYAVKELSRHMPDPRDDDWKALKRLGRYLISEPRVVQVFEKQATPRNLKVWVDTEFAGRAETRKSTSGGVVTFGGSGIKAWSVTQKSIALSSGEAEHYGIVRGSAMGIGIRNMFRDLGVKIGICVATDASVAKGIASRRGAGKVRHIEVAQLWVQEKVLSGEIKTVKVGTHDNVADALTKHVSRNILQSHMRGAGIVSIRGKHGMALQA